MVSSFLFPCLSLSPTKPPSLLLIETVEKVNNLVSFGGKADKRLFDWADQVKHKALRVRLMGAYYKYVTEDESRKQRRNFPAMQQSLIAKKKRYIYQPLKRPDI